MLAMTVKTTAEKNFTEYETETLFGELKKMRWVLSGGFSNVT